MFPSISHLFLRWRGGAKSTVKMGSHGRIGSLDPSLVKG